MQEGEMISCGEALRYKQNALRRLCYRIAPGGWVSGSEEHVLRRLYYRRRLEAAKQTGDNCGQQTEVDTKDHLKYVISERGTRNQVPPELRVRLHE